MKQLLDSGSEFENAIGYSRAVVVGDRVFVSGTTGFAYSTMTISESVNAQAEQCIKNLEAALKIVKCSLRDVVRVRYMLIKVSDFPTTWPVLQKAFGEVRPAATMIECGLADPRMKIEIEVDALIGSGALNAESLRL